MNVQPVQRAAMTVTHQRRKAPDIDGKVDPDQWMADALCAQMPPDEFFPEGKGGSTRFAKAVCKRCPVTTECLEFALRQEPTPAGVWGGLSNLERRRLKQQGAA